MTSVLSSIRAKVKRGEFPAPNGTEAYPAYVIAGAKGLIPEMESAARQTLDHPMTFEVLGEGLRLFEGWALRDLVSFRKRCKDNLVACLDLFLEVRPPGPSRIWVGCPDIAPTMAWEALGRGGVLPRWLNQLLSRIQSDLKLQKFTYPLNIHPRIREEYLMALRDHLNCHFCLAVHATKGPTFCTELEDNLAQARDQVIHSFYVSSYRIRHHHFS